jgi:hypothetical protein
MGEEKLMFVSRRDDGSIYGAWTVRQFLGQEELADGAPELVVFMTPRPMPDLSEIDNLDKVLKALALLTRQYANALKKGTFAGTAADGSKTVADTKADFATVYRAIP